MPDRLTSALEEIEAFGYSNPGHGFSCARIASLALGKEPRAASKWNRPDNIEADGFITVHPKLS